ncbi:MAG: UDP-N-acetylmuramoyl-L-alanyl-D-glutamate--2,6-diaminopimelate ligase [Rhodoferax sp.]|uniref:UDP-N-acetylmuramoyl-L-alanyl-D-glutamate--2, 6-diaminopimelate ligase n=1 Tax=Rhodoferax sp. TaxID=50421 RepID=UPI002ACDA2B0|nr:UDP-N-acetylmuramoyl-L-alanyl-D-glutamate--2,6-diaminopimelate ligase [Rhodoferax sp.]MDZ7891075.1 UDP-N-acetylmuramoyl-L-alanyl-D-glutamate--2,6-diaminopimelate ligase [Rhodoferax sp.]
MTAFTHPAAVVAWLRARGVQGLTTDNRTLNATDAFIAWPGVATDPRRFVSAALKQGALACVVDQDGADAFGFDAEKVAPYANLKADSGLIAAEFYGAPSRELALLAVTGTNGKTSTAWWLAQALGQVEGAHAKACGVIGTLGVGRPPSLTATGFTTPDPVLLQKTLRSFVDQGLTASAIEASSIGIEEMRMTGTVIHTAIFTNFTQDHLDYHGSMAAYWAAKRSLFAWEGLRAAVINVDDDKGLELAAELASSGLDLWTVGVNRPARLQARYVSHTAKGLAFDVVEGAQIIRMQSHVIGSYNVSNLLGVLATLRAQGIALAEAVAACSTLLPVPGRMECVGGDAAPLVAVDYAHTPDALDQALRALQPVARSRGGRLWCVFGCGGDRDATKRPLMGAVAAAQSDRVVVTSDNPRSERPESIVAQILLGMVECPHVDVQVDRGAAIAQVIAQAAAQDVVLLAGKGHEETQEVAGTKTPFSDMAYAKAALSQRQPTPGVVA